MVTFLRLRAAGCGLRAADGHPRGGLQPEKILIIFSSKGSSGCKLRAAGCRLQMAVQRETCSLREYTISFSSKGLTGLRAAGCGLRAADGRPERGPQSCIRAAGCGLRATGYRWESREGPVAYSQRCEAARFALQAASFRAAMQSCRVPLLSRRVVRVVLDADPYRAPSKCIRTPLGPVPTRNFKLADFGAHFPPPCPASCAPHSSGNATVLVASPLYSRRGGSRRSDAARAPPSYPPCASVKNY